MRSCPSQTAFIRTAKLNPYCRHHRQSASLPPPSRAGQRAGGRGHRRSRSTEKQATSDARPSGRRALIRTAKLHPCRPLTSGPAGRRAGPPAIPARPERRRRGDARPPWQTSPHPRCQAESLPPPSPPSRIPAAPSRAGSRAGGRGHRRSRSTGRQATRRPRSALHGAFQTRPPGCQTKPMPLAWAGDLKGDLEQEGGISHVEIAITNS
jgi:hypothetical protein